MKYLNLDDFGLEAFTPEQLNPLMSWHKGRNVDPRKYRARFNLRRGYRDGDPYIWTERLADWRHLETIHNRTMTDWTNASEAFWKYLKRLWVLTRKQCGKRVEGFYLQELRPQKSTSSYLMFVHKAHYGEGDSISYTEHEPKKEAKAHDASRAWIWLGTSEEEEANRLRRRDIQCRERQALAFAAFNEAVRIRLAAWWRQLCKEKGHSEYDYSYRNRRVFTAIENEGRSYGWISGMTGQGELVWSPQEPPAFFK